MFLLRDLKMVRVLGEGSYGRVFLVSFDGLAGLKMKKLYALKIMSKSQILHSNQLLHVYNEKAVMLSLYSSFFVRLYSTFQDKRYLFMVMEYVPGGELFSFMKEIIKFTVKQARFYIAEILVALETLHGLGIIYRDLKPENVLLDREGHIKLADFGFSKKLYQPLTWTLCGTPEYLAPEIVMNIGHGFEVDFWSLGVILYEMIVGQPPFYHENQVELCRLIIRGNIKFPAFVDPVSKDLIKQLLQTDRRKRLGYKKGVKMICRHSFFREINWTIVQSRSYTPPIIPVTNEENDRKDNPAGCSIQSHIMGMENDLPVMDQLFDQY
ncbi:protein kinase X [Nematocida parisii]|uniref:cAMP-dependent protein kinase n=1 Tax=Nematocida parisii (strain ERTm3) TaxID=935791 RepID=I3EHS6_NEMP3|nr:AGC/PKA protein kinase [Nematocida parisii ERTm1]EIJ88773.1 AGC/PKA protein kinase [Nematocida parisii ERTm3]KAI5125800.1 protein kinase X [Nematocida parisii]EIJ92682.1 AGC/PKA protein kinase [Nematocida parisii ERTm1]KAI5126773.1 protein kinase X [Nematocida parisii]KAI5140961.1 protein kinase X [Nematocida parisii]|eukprot:XP_013060200.1 AGC/PKA protein kinase [Nematocida parisii ERTm1]